MITFSVTQLINFVYKKFYAIIIIRILLLILFLSPFTKKKIDLTASDFCYVITKKNEKRGKLLSYHSFVFIILLEYY